MNQDIKNKLIQWVERLGDIASEQLPDFAQQIVSYQAYSASIWMYVGIGLLSVMVFLFLLFLWAFLGSEEERDDIGFMMFTIFVASMIPVLIIFCNYSNLKKCEVAPKLVIMDYIKR